MNALLNQPDRKLRVLLCGYGHLGYALLLGLLASPACEVVGVFRWSARPNTQAFWEPVETHFQQTVQSQNLRDIVCPGMNSFEFIQLLEELKPDVVLVGSWGEIIKKHLIERPGIVLVNCHPSKLPAHRGANPYTSVIRAGDMETGVTFHRMATKIDAGAIIAQRALAVDPHENGASLRDKCCSLAYEMVPDLVNVLYGTVVQGKPLPEQPQDDRLKSYYPSLKPEDGEIDWAAGPEALWRQYRALYPWVVCYSHLDGERIVLLIHPGFQKADRPVLEPPGTILSCAGGVLTIACGEAHQVVAVRDYQIEWGKGYLPVWLSRLLGRFLFRPGRQFTAKRPVAGEPAP